MQSVTLVGIEAAACEVEVNVADKGFAQTQIVGMPDAAVKESVERIRTAIVNCGMPAPSKRTLINLAPADIRKEGPALDLPIALGMLFAEDGSMPDTASHYVVVGELALDGRVRPVRGVLSMAMLAKKQGFKGIIVPRDNANEAAVVEDIEVIAVASLTEAVGFLTEQLIIEPTCIDIDAVFADAARYDVDFADVRGQEFCKRALTIAAAGSHNLLLMGPPGCGKTLMAKCLPTIMPALSRAESLETTRIWSASGKLPAGMALAAALMGSPAAVPRPCTMKGGLASTWSQRSAMACNSGLALSVRVMSAAMACTRSAMPLRAMLLRAISTRRGSCSTSVTLACVTRRAMVSPATPTPAPASSTCAAPVRCREAASSTGSMPAR